MTWRPIETAPKDGTQILVAMPAEDGGHFVDTSFWGDLGVKKVWLGSVMDPTIWMHIPDIEEDIVKFATAEGRQAQELMTDEQRQEFWRELQRGYCSECGLKTEGTCHCMNDE